ncbi:MAG: hypothetical protein ACFCU2_04810 [Acidimicrobiia bacterium]
MHKHDLDLIAEFAAGTLGDDSEARARVESCHTCAQEFTAQSSVLAELSGVGQALMTEYERARLHRDLWTELRSPAATAKPALTTPWWRSWTFGAAAFVVVAVSLVGVMENFGGGGDSEAFTEVAAGLESGADGSADTHADGDAAGGGELAEEALAPDFGPALSERDGDTPYLLIAREVRNQATSDAGVLSYDEKQVDCLEQSGLVDHYPVGGFEPVTELLVAVPSGADLESAPVAFVDPADCTVVHIED